MSRQRHNQKMLSTTAPSLSKDEVLKCTGQKDNFLQFARLIMVAGTRLFRELFNHLCPPEMLPRKLSSLVEKLPWVNHQERKCLYPSRGRCVTSDDFDICLLFKLLQVIIGFEQPDGGWDELPKESDHKISDELVRIKYYRNKICHACHNQEISDELFLELWEFIKGAMIGIAKHLPEGSEPWESAIDELSKFPITSAEEQFAKELNEWYVRDMDFKKELQEVKNVCRKIYRGMKKLSKEMADLKASVASVIDSSGNNNSNRDPPAIDVKNLPAKRLLKSRDLPSKSIPWEKVELPVDALLVTVRECELLSCVSFLNPGFYKSYHINLGYVYFGKIGEEGNAMKIALTTCEMVANGSTLTVKNTVEKVKPKAVFFVGCCSSLNANKVQLGDVVISSKLMTYADTKITQNEIRYRGIDVPLSRHLATLISYADEGWRPPSKNDVDLNVNVIKNGVILSGPEVVDNEVRRRELTKQFPDATAIEMEGVGLHAAARDLDMEWVVIKGVSDFADGKKSDTDAWTPYHASVMAASLTVHILSNPMAFEHLPHYGGAVTKDAETQTEITMNFKLFQQSVITTCQGENPDGQSLEEGLKRKTAELIDRVAKRRK